MRRFRLTSLVLCLCTGPVWAESLRLSLPLDCTLGESCYIQQYVDTDPGPEARDFTCGPLSYDGHKGTDFALPKLADMIAGVDVLAAAPGQIRAVRDDMPDTGLTEATRDTIEGRDCGNGLVITHSDGWETQYCHLKQGSVIAEQGAWVEAGDPLGQVGLSGRTEFPHLHISVRQNGQVVDPFQPNSAETCAPLQAQGQTLWTDSLPYQPGGLLDAGFATGIPDYDAVKRGDADVPLSQGSPALVVFAYGFGAREGDTIEVVIDGPQGTFLETTQTLDKPQAQYMRAMGRRTAQGLEVGTYTAKITLHRGDTVLGEKALTARVE